MKEGHLPVLAEEVLAMLAPRSGSLQIDATLGGGGHTERILEAAKPDGRLLGLDADPAAIDRVDRRLRPRFGERLVLRQANFRDLAGVGPAEGFDAVDGCLFDLGLSSFQLTDTDRGFGFRAGGQLDMRFDPGRGVPAAELLASLDGQELAALFRRYGEEPFAGRIARAIVEARRVAPIRTAEELAGLIERVAPARAPGRRRVHPATRAFQALRIAVNEELEALDPKKTRSIDIQEFVRLEEIDPIYYDSTYYLAPAAGAEKAYGLLLKAMSEAGKVAIGRVVLRTKEYLAAIRPADDVLVMVTMLFGDEVVDPDRLDELPARDGKAGKREVEMAQRLIESLSVEFDPGRHHDEYRERVLDLVERKAAGEEISVAPAEREEGPTPDLMAALEASLAEASGKATSNGRGRKRKAAPAKKSASKNSARKTSQGSRKKRAKAKA